MKYLTVTKAVEELAEDAKEIAFVFRTDTLTKNKFEQYQAKPCIVKLGDKTYNYPEIMEILDEPFVMQFRASELPRTKFTVLRIECTMKHTDKYDYYPMSIHPLATASLNKALEAQKLVGESDNRQLIGEAFVI